MRGKPGLWQRLRGERRDPGDQRPGYWPETRREAVILVLMVTGVIGLFAIVGALTSLSDRPGLEPWKAWTWALTSAATAVPGAILCLFAVRYASPVEWGWPRALGLHAGAALAYTLLHVAGFVALRKVVYAAMGDSYGTGPLLDEFPYELRKDLLTYAANVTVFWLAGERQRQVRTVEPRATFDIRDGSRLVRVAIEDIVAVSSAGNYVEFWLADGRRPLMRATLATVEVELERFGFVRAHRSWLVNEGRVTGLRPDGSGDWTVQLGLIEAPLSRRFPGALERLRSPRCSVLVVDQAGVPAAGDDRAGQAIQVPTA